MKKTADAFHIFKHLQGICLDVSEGIPWLRRNVYTYDVPPGLVVADGCKA